MSARRRGDAEMLYMVGVCELQLGLIEQARDTIEDAIQRKPNVARYYYDLAMAYRGLGELDTALARLDRMLMLSPGHEWGLAGRANIMALQGEPEQAFELLHPHAEKGFTEVHAAVEFADVALRLGKFDAGITAIEPFVNDASIPPARQMMALYRYGDLLRRVKRDDDAFAAYRKANDINSGAFNATAFSNAITNVMNGCSRDRISKLQESGDRDFAPVFIVGMPRSGTSLVEQILDAHPSFTGAGELETINGLVSRIENNARVCSMALLQHAQLVSAATVAQSARRYRKALPPGTDDGHVSDKMPTNFLHLGFISMIFPNARFIHCRRDPIDTCLSCYMHHFGGSHPYASSLTDLGAFWIEYDRIMAHWKSTLANPILDVRYEDLVADQEGESRRMIEFVGLPWDDQCLHYHESTRITLTASNEQVRQPIYRDAVKRWKRFEKHLGPLIDALGNAVPAE